MDNKPHTLKGQWNLLTKVHEKLHNIILDYNVINTAFEKNILTQNTKTTPVESIEKTSMSDVDMPKQLGKSNNINETHDKEPVSPNFVSESANVCNGDEFFTISPAEVLNERHIDISHESEVDSWSRISVDMTTSNDPEHTEMCNSNDIPNIPQIQQIIDNVDSNNVVADDIPYIKQEYTNNQPELVVPHDIKDIEQNVVLENISTDHPYVNNSLLTIHKTEVEETVTDPTLPKRKRSINFIKYLDIEDSGDEYTPTYGYFDVEEDSDEEYTPTPQSQIKRNKTRKCQSQKDKLQVKLPSKITKTNTTSTGKAIHCERCDYVASCRSLLVKHELMKHFPQTTLCTLCKKEMSNAVSLYAHRIKHYNQKIYRCGICSREFKLLKFFENHQKMHTIDENKLSITCKLCLEEFSDKTGLNDHIISSHYKREPGAFQCNVCEKEFPKWKTYQHIESHRQVVMYLCDICEETFLKKCDLREHLKSHENEPQRNDQTTADDINPLTTDDKHANSNSHSKPLVKHGYGKRIYNDNELRHPCKTCGEVFSTQGKRRTHILNTHAGKASKCDQCGKTYSNAKYLKRHIDYVHLKPKIKCDVCGQLYAISSWSSHAKSHRSDYKEQIYSCDLCDKSYRGHTSKAQLQRHIKMVHERCKEEHLCNMCGKVFGSHANLRNHVKIHTDKRPHVCHVCGAAYKIAASLRIHLRTHQDKGKYNCTYCGKNFKFGSSLRGHMKTHEGRYDHVCHICGRKFREKCAMKRHQKIHTGEKPYFCKLCGMHFRFMCVVRVHLQGKHKINKPKGIWLEDCGKC